MQARWVFTNPQESYLTKAQVSGWRAEWEWRLARRRRPRPPLPTHPPTSSPTHAHRLTHAQEVSLNYHMKCEQYAHSAAHSFFNFNGTAGAGPGAAGVPGRSGP